MSIDAMFPTQLAKREDETLQDYWLSFSPLAPFFGVPYRFAEMLKPADLGALAPKGGFAAFSFGLPGAKPAPAPTPAPAPAAPVVKEAVKPVEEVIEAVAAPVEEAPIVEAPAEAAPAEADGEGVAPAGLLAEAPAVIDDLKLLKGVGPKLEAELNAIGVYTFAQIAEMSEDNLHWIDAQISSVRGRPIRDDWAGQAKALAGL